MIADPLKQLNATGWPAAAFLSGLGLGTAVMATGAFTRTGGAARRDLYLDPVDPWRLGPLLAADYAEFCDTLTCAGTCETWVRQARKRVVQVLLQAADGRGLAIDIHDRKPEWFDLVVSQMERALRLQDGWHSGRGRAVDIWAAAHALELLGQTMRDNTPSPSVVPTSRGTIGLAWHTRGIDLEVEVLPDGRISVSYEDQDGHEWDAEYGRHVDRVRDLLGRFSQAQGGGADLLVAG